MSPDGQSNKTAFLTQTRGIQSCFPQVDGHHVCDCSCSVIGRCVTQKHRCDRVGYFKRKLHSIHITMSKARGCMRKIKKPQRAEVERKNTPLHFKVAIT